MSFAPVWGRDQETSWQGCPALPGMYRRRIGSSGAIARLEQLHRYDGSPMISLITVTNWPHAMSSPAIRAATVVSNWVSDVTFMFLRSKLKE
jgi:hypothetical protein